MQNIYQQTGKKIYISLQNRSCLYEIYKSGERKGKLQNVLAN